MPAIAAPPRIGIVIVTHASGGVFPDLLTSLGRHEPDAAVVIVDSGSPDGPPTDVDASVVALTNVGFGTACNAGVRHLDAAGAAPEWIVCLNPDVRLTGPSLTELVAAMAARADVGVATGPVVDALGDRQPSAWGPTSTARALWFASGLRLPRLRRAVGRLGRGGGATGASSMAVDDLLVEGHVLGGAMVVRRDCWDELGGFDEGYFLYWEDADLCTRARAAGWEVRVLPCRPIVHLAGTSSDGVTSHQRWDWYVAGARRFAQLHLDDTSARRLLAGLRWGRRIARLRGAGRGVE